MPVTSSGVAYDRSSPRDGVPVLFIHAGIADRRMWDPQWAALADTWDLTRLDLRGFGASDTAPAGPQSRGEDVMEVMKEAGLERVHLVGASLGAGVAVEVALTTPNCVASLFLCPPGGSLLATVTDDLVAFAEEENAALDARPRRGGRGKCPRLGSRARPDRGGRRRRRRRRCPSDAAACVRDR